MHIATATCKSFTEALHKLRLAQACEYTMSAVIMGNAGIVPLPVVQVAAQPSGWHLKSSVKNMMHPLLWFSSVYTCTRSAPLTHPPTHPPVRASACPNAPPIEMPISKNAF